MIARLVLIAAAFALGACNTTAEVPAPTPQPVAQTSANYVTPAGFRLPEGAGCSGELARFRAVMDNDLATGHVAREVHGRVISDLSGAQATCSAGREGEAMAQLRTVKTRYGYP